MRPKSLAVTGAALAIVLGLFLFLPLPYWRRASFVIEPAARVPVRASEAGFITNVLVKEGDAVRRGALLAVGRDVDLEQKRDALRSQMSELDRSIRIATAQEQAAESVETQRRRQQLDDDLAETEARLRRLNLIATADGVVVTPRLENRVGAMLKRGEQFCEIASTGSVRARVTVDDWDLGDVAIGARASLRFNAATGQEQDGHIVSIAPASEIHQRLAPANENEAERERANEGGVMVIKASDVKSGAQKSKLSAREQAEAAATQATSPFEAPLTRFDAMIEMDSDTLTLKPGMSGEVKIYGRRRSLGLMAWEGVRDWFRSQIWW